MSNERFELFWKEYPKRDIEYIRVYPTSVTNISQEEVWGKRDIVIYIHIPFCKSLCNYCPFTKYIHDDAIIEQYLKALYKEIEMASSLPYIRGSEVSSLCLGGGTPTTLSEKQFSGLIEHCKKSFNLKPGLEISVEANPDTINTNKVQCMLDCGVNRISFGVQSFNDEFLEIIGRAHKNESTMKVIDAVKSKGIDNIGIDLLYRLPGQTLDHWKMELETAVNLNIDYIATFCLSLVPGTPLFENVMKGMIPRQPSEEVEFMMFDMIKEILIPKGYKQQYIHDFALPGKECAYHKASFFAPQKECLALGAAGRSYINGFFYANVHPVDEYIKQINDGKLPIHFGRKLSKRDEMSRFMVLGVKFLTVSKEAFRENFGVSVETVFQETLDKLKAWRLIKNTEKYIIITDKGQKYISNICKAFYSANDWGILQPNGIELQNNQGDFVKQFSNVE